MHLFVYVGSSEAFVASARHLVKLSADFLEHIHLSHNERDRLAEQNNPLRRTRDVRYY